MPRLLAQIPIDAVAEADAEARSLLPTLLSAARAALANCRGSRSMSAAELAVAVNILEGARGRGGECALVHNAYHKLYGVFVGEKTGDFEAVGTFLDAVVAVTGFAARHAFARALIEVGDRARRLRQGSAGLQDKIGRTLEMLGRVARHRVGAFCDNTEAYYAQCATMERGRSREDLAALADALVDAVAELRASDFSSVDSTKRGAPPPFDEDEEPDEEPEAEAEADEVSEPEEEPDETAEATEAGIAFGASLCPTIAAAEAWRATVDTETATPESVLFQLVGLTASVCPPTKELHVLRSLAPFVDANNPVATAQVARMLLFGASAAHHIFSGPFGRYFAC